MDITNEQPTPVDAPSPSEIQDLIQDIQKINPELAIRLGEVSRVESGPDLAELAHADLYKVFDPEGIEVQAFARYSKWSWLLIAAEWIRNILVLCPIALTWFALFNAATNYNLLLTQSPGKVVDPFLLLWERRFDGVGSLTQITFSQTALIDFLCLAAIILITGFVHFQRDILEVTAERHAASLRKRLEKYLWGLETKLSAERYRQNSSNSGEQFNNAFHEFQSQTDQMLQLTRAEMARLANLGTEREKEFASIRDFIVTFKHSTELLGQYSQNVFPLYQKIQTSVSGMTNHLEAQDNQKLHLEQSLVSFSSTLTSVAGSLTTMERNLSKALLEIQQTDQNTLVDRQLVTKSVQNLGELAAQIVASQTGFRVALQEMNDNNTNINGGLNKTFTKLQQVSTELITRMASVGEMLGISVGDMRKSMSALTTAMDTQKTYSTEMVSVVRDLKATISQFARELEKIPQSITRLENAMSSAQRGITIPLAIGSNPAPDKTPNYLFPAILGILGFNSLLLIVLIVVQVWVK